MRSRLLACFVFSILLHLTFFGLGGRFLFGTPRPAILRPRSAVQVTLIKPRPRPTPAPRRPKPKRIAAAKAPLPVRRKIVVVPPAPIPTRAPVARRVKRPIPFHPTRVASVVLAPVPIPMPVPVPRVHAPAAPRAAMKAPKIDAPLSLGIKTGDRSLAPAPLASQQPHLTAASRPRKLEPVGSGGGGGRPAIGPIAANAPPAGTTSEGGTGAGQGGGSGSGAGRASGSGVTQTPGNGAGGARGVPFGDPSGSPGGSPNGGGIPGGTGNGSGVFGGDAGGGGPIHVVYVMDVSSSMNENGKIVKARAALRQALSQLRPDDEFDVVTFADKARSFSRDLRPATPDAIAETIRQIDSIRLPEKSYTDLWAAMDKALKISGVTHIFLMTDGDPTKGAGVDDQGENADPNYVNYEEIRGLVRDHNPSGSVRIFALALGAGEQWGAIRLLKQIAADNHGSYGYVNVLRR